MGRLPRGIEVQPVPNPRGLEVQPHDRKLVVLINWKKTVGKPDGDFCSAFNLDAYLSVLSSEDSTSGTFDKEAKIDVSPDTCVALTETAEQFGVRYEFLQVQLSTYGGEHGGDRGGYYVRPKIANPNAWDKLDKYHLTKGALAVEPQAYKAIFDPEDKTRVLEFKVIRS